MSDQEPEPTTIPETAEKVIEHSEERSITGSAQAIGLEPSEDFVAPTMALDSFEPESD